MEPALTHSGPHTYSSGTNVNNGTLKLGASNSLPDVGAVSVAAGAVLNIDRMTDTITPRSASMAARHRGNLTHRPRVTLGDRSEHQREPHAHRRHDKNRHRYTALVTGAINTRCCQPHSLHRRLRHRANSRSAAWFQTTRFKGNEASSCMQQQQLCRQHDQINAGTLKVGVAGIAPAGTALTP